MITIIPIEPVSQAHALLVIEAFNRFFVDRGGSKDGYGDGYGDGRGFGVGNVPEEWLIDEISMKPTGG